MYEILMQRLAEIPGFTFTPENMDWIIEMLCSQIERTNTISEMAEAIPSIVQQVMDHIDQLPAHEESWPAAPHPTLAIDQD